VAIWQSGKLPENGHWKLVFQHQVADVCVDPIAFGGSKQIATKTIGHNRDALVFLGCAI